MGFVSFNSINISTYKEDASYELGTYVGMISRILKKRFTYGNSRDKLFERDDCTISVYIHKRNVRLLNEEWEEYWDVIESTYVWRVGVNTHCIYMKNLVLNLTIHSSTILIFL